MKLSKKKVFTLALAVCLIAILSMSSLAWFTDDDSVTNDFNIAGSEDNDPDDVFSVNVWEKDKEGNIYDDVGIEYPAILPGDKLTKEAHIENTGSYEQYIRATVTVTGAYLWQELYGQHVVPLDVLTNADLSGVHTLVAYFDAAQDAFVYELYYTDILPVGKDIVVFDTVNIHEGLDRYQAAALQNFQITVTADAVQTKNVGNNVYEAFETVGLVKDVPVTDAAGLAAALQAEGEARIVLDPNVDWSANPIVVDYAVSDKIIDFGGMNGTINFAAGATAENVVVTGIKTTDGTVPSVKTDKAFTGDLTITNCSFFDAKAGNVYGAVVLAGGDVTVDQCSFSSDGSTYTYGIYNSGAKEGSLTITNSTFENFGSWAIQINNAINGDVVIDNCVFDTPDGVLKVLSGVNGNFTFTNNTLIGCKGHDGAGFNALIVSTSAKYSPLTATGTITYANNKYITTGGEEMTFVSSADQLNVAPAPLEEDFLFPAGTNFVLYKDMVIAGDAQITHTENTGLGLSNVTANVSKDLIIRKSAGAICIENCNFTLNKGAKLITVAEGGDAYQVFLINVTVNGELLTQENAGQYLEGISWFQAIPVAPEGA